MPLKDLFRSTPVIRNLPTGHSVPTEFVCDHAWSGEDVWNGNDIQAEEFIPLEFPDLEAAEEEPTGPRQFLLRAYTGVPVELNGFFFPVVVDLTGVTLNSKRLPVLMDHDTKVRIGHTAEQVILPAGGTGTLDGKAIKGPIIAAVGLQSSSMNAAEGFVKDAKSGFPFQVSIGARLQQGRFVEEGDKVEVNGRTWKGPLIVAEKTLLRELSVLVLGADSKTSATLTASQRKENMNFETFVKSLGLEMSELSDDQRTRLEAAYKKQDTNPPTPTPAPANVPPTDVKATAPDAEAEREMRAAEVERCAKIDAAIREYGPGLADIKVGDETFKTPAEFQAHAIRKNLGHQDVELTLMKSKMSTGNINGKAPGFSVPDTDIKGDCLQASLLRFAGVPEKQTNPRTGREYGLATMFPPDVLEMFHRKEYRVGGSIQALMDLQIRAAGHYYPGSSRSDSDFIALAVQSFNEIQASGFSTLNIPNVLENVMHKTALAAFESVETVWQFFCGRRNLKDFRPHNLYRLTADGRFRQVAVDGELKHISMTDEKQSLSADTFGCMITIDRKTMRNDDLGVVLDKARGIGSLGGQRIEESFFVLLLSNPDSFFHADNGNLNTGAGSALALAGLEASRLSFRNQLKAGLPIGLSPSRILVGTGLETLGNQLFVDENLAATGNTDAKVLVSNPHKGLYKPYVSPYMNNTGITDQDGNSISGQSATKWFMTGDPGSPQGAPIYIGFIDGVERPYFDEAQTQFNVPGGMQFRSYLDWGVAMGFTELAVQNAGA